MEQLDGLARSVGQNACNYLSQNGHDTMGGFLCSDGDYSAGWKLIVAMLVIFGLLLAWLGASAGKGQRL